MRVQIRIWETGEETSLSVQIVAWLRNDLNVSTASEVSKMTFILFVVLPLVSLTHPLLLLPLALALCTQLMWL